ncbi:MAG: Hpt domain-containing protein [Ekhidna sp.]|uniref:Hpt domain-containing protein n=1 Tax=Ekhidna sp. TaxID=2608089 RepID=UPI0032EBCDF7
MEKIDFTYLEVLGEDDPDFKSEFVETFEETYTMLVAKMENELKTGDLDNLAKSAHQLKPSAKMIQLPCGDTLEQLQHNPGNASIEVLKDIHQQCEDALRQLKEWAGV